MCILHAVSTLTISMKREAYERLRAARRYPTESFSEVVLRATWPEDTITARELLRSFARRRSSVSEESLNRIEALKKRDRPPVDKWARR